MSRLFVVGGLLALLVVLLPFVGRAQSTPSPEAVVVTEVMYAPSPSTNEFIELYNRSDAPVNLGTLEYADSNQDFAPVTSTDTLLSPGEHVVLVRDTEAFETAFPSVDYLAPPNWDALNNGGDLVLLRTTAGTVLDSLPYDPSWGGADGRSLERIDPAAPSDRASNFGSSTAETGATPAARNSIFDPDTTPPSLQRVRPTADGDSVVARFSEPLDVTTISTTTFHLDDPTAPMIADVAVSDTAASEVHIHLATTLPAKTYTLVATNVADRQGNVQAETLADFSYFDPAVPAPKDLVVNEILYDPPDSGTEFIELYNRSDKTVDLGAIAVADEDRDFTRVAAPLTPLRPDSHAVIARDAEAFEMAFPEIKAHVPGTWDALNNGGDTVILRHVPSGTEIDAVPYDPSWGGRDGHSLERIDPAGPSTAAFNFGTSTTETGATPGRQNSRYDPDETAPAPVFAEQVTETTAEVTFSEPLRAVSVTPNAFTLETTRVTRATLVRDSVAVLSFADAPSATQLRIKNIRDRVDNTLESASLPLALQPTPDDIVINEILFDPRTDDFDDRPNQVEYVEVKNRTDQPLTVHGLFATDRPSEDGTADTLRTARRVALSPNGYGVVAAAPNGVLDPSNTQIAHAFPEAPLDADSVAFLGIDANRLGLDVDGTLVRLHRADGTPIGEVSYVPDWHAEGLEETKGTALERISPTGRPNAADNWTSSPAPAGGTPGTANAVSLSPSDPPPKTTLEVAPSPFSVARDGATRIQYALDDVPNLVRVRIFDARGRKVRTLEDARLTGRTGELVWNGRNDAGNRVRVGIYVVLFEAVRADDGTVTKMKAPVVVARPLH